MITRAHAKSHHFIEVTEKKRDPNEATFRTTTEFLPFWRAVLRYRDVTGIPAIHNCRSWVQDEFKQLQAVVRTLAQSVSLTSTDAAAAWNQLSLPPSFLRCQQMKTPEGVDPSDHSSGAVV